MDTMLSQDRMTFTLIAGQATIAVAEAREAARSLDAAAVIQYQTWCLIRDEAAQRFLCCRDATLHSFPTPFPVESTPLERRAVMTSMREFSFHRSLQSMRGEFVRRITEAQVEPLNFSRRYHVTLVAEVHAAIKVYEDAICLINTVLDFIADREHSDVVG